MKASLASYITYTTYISLCLVSHGNGDLCSALAPVPATPDSGGNRSGRIVTNPLRSTEVSVNLDLLLASAGLHGGVLGRHGRLWWDLADWERLSWRKGRQRHPPWLRCFADRISRQSSEVITGLTNAWSILRLINMCIYTFIFHHVCIDRTGMIHPE